MAEDEEEAGEGIFEECLVAGQLVPQCQCRGRIWITDDDVFIGWNSVGGNISVEVQLVAVGGLCN